MFILRGYGRCGTEMLRTALDTHSNIRCHGELFAERHYETIDGIGVQRYLHQHKLLSTDGFVLMAESPRHKESRHHTIDKVWEAVETLAVPVVAVERMDLLRMAASAVIAQTTGTHHVYLHEKPRRTTHTLVMTPQQLCLAVDSAIAAFEATSVLFPWAHVVRYEDMVRDWEHTINDVLDYIGVKHELIGAMTRRQEVRKIKDVVYNYDELKEKLYSTRPDLFDIAEQCDDLFD